MFEAIKQQMIDTCRLFSQIGLVHETAGNISVKVKQDDKTLLVVTPASFPYEQMTVDDLPVLDLDGAVVDGHTKPSSESPMHLAVHRAFDDVGTVIHTHSMYATAYAIANKSLKPIHLLSLYLGGGVPVAPFATPGTDELGRSVVNTMKSERAKAVLLQNHGVLVTGTTFEETVYAAKFVELIAEMQFMASAIGEPTLIPEDFINAFLEKKVV